MRDHADNCVVVCGSRTSIPWGHTGDSITVAPIQTLSDVGTRRCATTLRGPATRGSGNGGIQRAVRGPTPPRASDRIEITPGSVVQARWASKATGFPIAKIAARLAVGYTLDEIRNDITEVTRPVLSR